MLVKRICTPLAILAALAGPVVAQPVFTSPMELAAVPSAKAILAPLNALAAAGSRTVAAGQRGHILYSDDGKAWQQAQVPVSSDLTALAFPSARQGWAVGHEGVILHTTDGGATWSKQLDGRQIAELVGKSYGAPANADDPEAQRLQQEAEAFVAQGADKPLLDVWFENDQKGFVVGAFNLILRTEDGGKSWTPWLDRIDNPRGMHLYGIRPAGGSLFIVGEQGLALKLDATGQRFQQLQLPYQGTLFGLLGNAEMVLVYGLRGNAYRSVDGGVSWSKVETHVHAGLTAGIALADGSVVLVSQAGHVLRSRDQGASFAPAKPNRVAPNFAVAPAAGGAVALAGIGGVRVENLQ
ncbi:YCF48-related protein [Pseudomonas sp. LS44]|uniref:WD40/YVTN/BNR-like repeat-containing protein n=1 Tax=Pseudomonas sp. LS44 TaxID=1357074 RepID=UPI00215A7870|nr:YCF48-related protein [Pseudomonas sp. LS44]UVE19549.1 YCF48-related protein [Pseudomonas sp. LS44]